MLFLQILSVFHSHNTDSQPFYFKFLCIFHKRFFVSSHFLIMGLLFFFVFQFFIWISADIFGKAISCKIKKHLHDTDVFPVSFFVLLAVLARLIRA